jgi:hypothetical protein
MPTLRPLTAYSDDLTNSSTSTEPNRMPTNPKLKTKQNLLLGVLYFSIAWETLLTMAGFFSPKMALEAFKLPYNDATFFLGHVLAWMFLLISLLCLEAIILVKANRVYGTRLSMLLGLWWTGLGLVLFFAFGKWENLILDGLKGLLLAYFAYDYHRASSAQA